MSVQSNIQPRISIEDTTAHWLQRRSFFTTDHDRELFQRILDICHTHTLHDGSLSTLLSAVQELFDAEASALVLHNDLTGDAEVTVALGSWATRTGYQLPRGMGISGQVIASGQPYMDSPFKSRIWCEWPHLVGTVYALICVPLNTQIGTLGALCLGQMAPTTRHQQCILTILADIIAGWLVRQKGMMLRTTPPLDLELIAANEALVSSWLHALGFHDRFTTMHSQNTATLALRLAQQLSIPETDLPAIHQGALLHDIGKILIPTRILLKPTLLTGEEWQIIQQHPRYARQMLDPMPMMHALLDIPSYHHERWDGQGYPYGLRGSDIPLAARLFAVVDMWDALLSNRPYRKAWTAADADAYLRRQAGKHLDADIVSAFLHMLD